MTLQTALIGFGKIAQGYSRDKRMSKQLRYSTHAQVLNDHPAFLWRAVVDRLPGARQIAKDDWNITDIAEEVSSLKALNEIEIAIIATPPGERLQILKRLPNLKAVLVEKPLGSTLMQAIEFLDECRKRSILVQVNLLRRADAAMRRLAEGELRHKIGTPQAAFIHYGNGLLNNGAHMIDLARMLLGEVQDVSVPPNAVQWSESPISGDENFPLDLHMHNGLMCRMQPLRFENYRENSIDIWGDRGRLAITQEGLLMLEYALAEHRSLEGAHELPTESPLLHSTSIGAALYDMYTNLAEAVDGQGNLWSPGDSALVTAEVVEAAFLALIRSNRLVSLADLSTRECDAKTI